MGHFWRQNRLLVAGFVLAFVVMLFFAVRFTISTIYWSDPAHREQPIQPWMTIGYVSHSWKVPRQAFIDGLDLTPPTPGNPPTLAEIAKAKGMSDDQLKTQLETIIRDWKTEHKSP